ncbi:MAG: thioredoxin family protein [Thalassobaculales bacterium]
MPQMIASRQEWLAARKALLAREKELTRLEDELAAARRALPWVKVEKDYAFDTPQGRRSLAELFDGRSQLMVYHFMFGPDWQQGCPGCSFLADHIDGANLHLAHHDVTLLAASRAPLERIEAYRRRMGWRFSWVSSLGSDFNYDFGVSFTPEQRAAGEVVYNYAPSSADMDELPGLSVFAKAADGAVFHTYSTYGRGPERAIGAYMFLDLTPAGRNETGPNFNLGDWVKRHDEYAAPAPAPACCGGP